MEHVLYTSIEVEGLHVIVMKANEAVLMLGVFSEIAAEQGWEPKGELSAYPDDALYFVAVKDYLVVGGIMLVLGNDIALPITKVWPETQLIGRTDVADLALLAFLKEHRGNLHLIWATCVEVWRYCVACGVNEIWAELTPRNLKLYRRMGWPFREMGELRSHWGEPCLPCMLNIDDARAAVSQRAQTSPLFRDLSQQAFRDEEYGL